MKLKRIAEPAFYQQMSGQNCHSCMAPVDITLEEVRKLLSNLSPYNADLAETVSSNHKSRFERIVFSWAFLQSSQ